MNKYLLVVIIILLLSFTTLSFSYIEKSKETKAAWDERFDRCMNSIDRQREQYLMHNQSVEEIDQCLAQGGCTICAPCGQRPKLTVSRFIQDITRNSHFSCTAECRPSCIYPADQY